MTPITPLLAAGVGDLIWLVLVILFIVVPAVGQLIAKMAQQQGPKGGQPARPRAGGAPAPRPAAGGLEDEIGEFLRRAAQRRAVPPAGPIQPTPPPPRVPVAVAQPIEAELVRQPALGEGIKQHVGEHLDASEFRRRTAELGEQVAQADEQIEQRLRATFDREVSSLAGVPGESASPPGPTTEKPPGPAIAIPSTATSLAAMLSNPEGICQAIVLSEVFTRPEHRWA